MIKNILATLGILAVVAGIAVWQFGFLSDQAAQMSKKVDRATAAARASKAISETKAKEIQNCGVNELFVLVDDPEEGEIRHKIIANNTVEFARISDVPLKARAKDFGLLPTVFYPNYKFSQVIAEECKTLPVEEVAEEAAE